MSMTMSNSFNNKPESYGFTADRSTKLSLLSQNPVHSPTNNYDADVAMPYSQKPFLQFSVQ